MARKHKFQGRERLERIFRQMPVEAREALQVSLEKSAKDLVRAQQALVPVRSGALRASIGYTVGGAALPKHAAFAGGSAQRGGGDIAIQVHAGNSEVRYAHLVEFGTKAAEARPFFLPAYRLQKKRIVARARRAARAAARKARAAEGAP